MAAILVVDDEQSMREFLAICLKREGHDVVTASSGEQALAAAEQNPTDVIVTDLKMPGKVDGLGLLSAVKEKGLDCEVIVVTAYATPETAISARTETQSSRVTRPSRT